MAPANQPSDGLGQKSDKGGQKSERRGLPAKQLQSIRKKAARHREIRAQNIVLTQMV